MYSQGAGLGTSSVRTVDLKGRGGGYEWNQDLLDPRNSGTGPGERTDLGTPLGARRDSESDEGRDASGSPQRGSETVEIV